MKVKSAWIVRAAVCCTLVTASPDLCGAGQGQDSTEDRSKTISAEDALTLALHHSGIGDLAEYDTTHCDPPALVTVENDDTPFLAGELNGREVWQVRLREVPLRFESYPRSDDDVTRDFEVLLDRLTGQFLKIRSVMDDSLLVFGVVGSSAEKIEKQMHLNDEAYHDFVDNPDIISFWQALEACPGNEASASYISGVCVMRSKRGREPEPVWVVTSVGMSPFMVKVPPLAYRDPLERPPPGPFYALNRCEVNAITGQWLEHGSRSLPKGEDRR